MSGPRDKGPAKPPAKPPMEPMTVMGLMSGTSLDGVDALLARFEPRPDDRLGGRFGERFGWRVLARRSAPYPAPLAERLAAALTPGGADTAELTQLHTEVGLVYAEQAAALAAEVEGVEGAEGAEGARVELVALSGQTVYHIPGPDEARGWRQRSTLQLGEAAFVCERLGVPVIADFRQADLAAGGGGAPMVSFGDLMCYAEAGVARAVHNLGGISNLTWLPPDGDPAAVLAFDTGPANCLVDDAARARFALPRDDNGRLAAAGRVDTAVLARLLEHPFLRRPPPKTTGREAFNYRELVGPSGLATLSGEDALATLTAFTAESVARAYRDWVLPRRLDEVLVAGGGALNPTLMGMLRERLEPLGARVRSFEACGWDPRDREALAFAAMAYAAWHGRTNTLPSATGARHPVVAGKWSLPPR